MRAKKIRSLSYLLLMFILCFCPICNVSATEPDQAKANLVTDKEKYNESEQIRTTFTLESDETLNDIQVNFSDLKGYEQKVTIDNTKKSYQTVYTPEKKGWFVSKTGDTSKWILYLISFCIATIFILIIMKTLNILKRNTTSTTFKRTNICTMHATEFGKVFLRVSFFFTIMFYIAGKYFNNIHDEPPNLKNNEM